MAATKGKTTEAAEKTEEFISVHTKFEAYTGEEPYLFVSYSHLDTEKVYPILDMLYDRRYRMWYDESCENGNDFRDELRERIEHSEAVLLFVSKSSMSSPFCGMEIIVARENGKRLYPIYLESSAVSPAFELLLANTHHGTIDDPVRLIRSLVRDLPATAMDRLMTENGLLRKCEDNGSEITVDEGITTICAGAFKNRMALRQIILPQSLTLIEKEGFRACSNLQEMTIPEHTLRIGDSAFRDCLHLKKLVVQNDTIKIGERAFENCISLEQIILPDGLTEFYAGVFNSCKSLVQIRLPQNLTILGERCLADCDRLETIDVPENVTKIDDAVFGGCESLKEVTLHEGLKKIGKNAFKDCSSLTRVVIPVSVISIGEAVFRGCGSMRSIRVESRNKYYKSEPNKLEGTDHVLFNKNKSTLIAYPASSREVQYDVPDSVTVISEWAFSECKKLNRITIPDSVHEINEGAFSNCVLLDEVEIPDSVTKIDDSVFKGCANLEKIVVPDSVTDLGWGVFDGCEDTVTVYCTENSAIYDYCMRNHINVRSMEEKDLD